ncbi:MAG: hypothetical protein QGG48_10660, partial [Desulfatiglandales bacterium]|nr:hypothetical protein [Desulfatiglandales bacterium]
RCNGNLLCLCHVEFLEGNPIRHSLAALIRARRRSPTQDRVKIAAFRKEIPTAPPDSVGTDCFSKR